MPRIILVHRWSGGPSDDWRPWLKQELTARGHEVFAPTMPDTDAPEIGKWVRHLAEVVGTSDEGNAQTYFVGHSIGCQAILRYLQTIGTPVGGAVFVAGWFDLKNMEDAETQAIAKPWIETPIDGAKIRRVLPKSVLLISDNDPYDAYEENVRRFSGEIGSRVVTLPGAGHFTEEKVPEILEEVVKMLES